MGTLYLTSGEKFIGNFVDSKVTGDGTFYKIDGNVIVGQWQNNKFLGNV